MIGKIRGILLEKQPPELLIDVQGVGYEIQAPMSTFYQLPDCGTEVSILTHLIVREDAHLLFGFYSKDERHLFRTLLKVNGVGPKLALTILSSISAEDFVHSVLGNDITSLVRLPGVGKKTAERLVIEMRDKVSDWHSATMTTETDATVPAAKSGRRSILHDAISALISLGYKSPEANRCVTKIDDGVASSEELIRRALREMM